jgi:hypothetical protein
VQPQNDQPTSANSPAPVPEKSVALPQVHTTNYVAAAFTALILIGMGLGYGGLVIVPLFIFGLFASFKITKNQANQKTARPVVRIFSALAAIGIACVICLTLFIALIAGLVASSGESS